MANIQVVLQGLVKQVFLLLGALLCPLEIQLSQLLELTLYLCLDAHGVAQLCFLLLQHGPLSIDGRLDALQHPIL